jgi:hypothetical protein
MIGALTWLSWHDMRLKCFAAFGKEIPERIFAANAQLRSDADQSGFGARGRWAAGSEEFPRRAPLRLPAKVRRGCLREQAHHARRQTARPSRPCNSASAVKSTAVRPPQFVPLWSQFRRLDKSNADHSDRLGLTTQAMNRRRVRGFDQVGLSAWVLACAVPWLSSSA